MYCRLRGVKGPLGLTRLRSISLINSDLEQLGIIATKSGDHWYIETGFVYDPIPDDLPTLNVDIVRSMCQLVVDLVGNNPFVFRPGEQSIWYDLFDRIGYEIRIYLGRIRLIGLRNKYVI